MGAPITHLGMMLLWLRPCLLLLDDLPIREWYDSFPRPIDGDGCPPRSLPRTTRLPTNDGASVTHVEVAPVIPTVPPTFMTTKVPNVHGPVHGATKSPNMPPTTCIFIGNIPLDAHDSAFDTRDTFVAAFNNSFRKTLSYVTPTIQNGHKLYFRYLNAYVRSVWSAVKDITATSTGFYFFRFKSKAAMEEVIEGGPWLFQGLPIVLQKWESGMVLRKHKHTHVPVWIKLHHLSIELWTTDGLSTVVSGIGWPLYPDDITRACIRLDFARICVMLDIASKLPKHSSL
ncbi:hypothetical protein Sango_0807300 [Sesamum angolense]|uniref:DUF4283 domain-containing protein n=1 Tax=Sesamum angolense TaxID=2727404 RepID=A0AAE2C0C5_9LAMI|nr:hypothetical protein Sango_0807300 [Sesamum angolense]